MPPAHRPHYTCVVTGGVRPQSAAGTGPLSAPRPHPDPTQLLGLGGPPIGAPPRRRAAPGGGRVDWAHVDSRRASLAGPRVSSANTLSKSRDARDLAAFLATCPASRSYGAPLPLSLASCTGQHVVDYIIARSLRPSARTVIHAVECPRPAPPAAPCACPRTLASSSVDSLIGRLRAAFNEMGRAGLVNGTSPNPCAEFCVQQYLRDVTAEQARAGITPLQAVPVLSDKLAAVFEAMRVYLEDPSLSTGTRFATLRCRAMFALAFRSLKRGAEIVTTRTGDVLSFPSGDGLLFNYTWGKTLRDGSAHVFGIPRDDASPATCAVRLLHAYVDGARALGVDLSLPGRGALLFRPWLGSPQATAAATEPLNVPDLNPALRGWLQHLGIYEGETFPGFRSGGSIGMALNGDSLRAIMDIGYWKTPRMARHYMGFASSAAAGGPLPAPAPASGSAQAPPLSTQDRVAAWRDTNELRGFHRAFG